MTLNLTLLTEDAIYQAADFRLTDATTGRLITDASPKIVQVSTPDSQTLFTYTGIGRVGRKDTSESMVEWLTGITGPPTDLVEAVAEKGARWLSTIHRQTGRRDRHSFVAVAFLDGTANVWVVSNFESADGSESAPRPDLRISHQAYRGKPVLIVNGQKAAVNAKRSWSWSDWL